MKKIVAVIGGNVCKKKKIKKISFDTGREIALRGYILLCGGMGGVMEESCRGAKSVGGLTVGILPGKNLDEANRFIDIPILTAMSHARNAIIVRSAECIISIDGEYGTLSEIALAKSIEKPVFGINTWDIKGVIKVNNAKEALDLYEKMFRK
jgi:uncharacterized protein (TIGR00725 family)